MSKTQNHQPSNHNRLRTETSVALAALALGSAGVFAASKIQEHRNPYGYDSPAKVTHIGNTANQITITSEK